MKYAFGAAPMPTVNSRAPPMLLHDRPTSSASLLTLPSVMNTIWRRLSAIGGMENARSSADAHFGAAIGAQVVDELAGAACAFTRSPAASAGNRLVASLLKRMMLNVSPGCEPLTPSRSAARACSIDGPLHRAGRVDDEQHLALVERSADICGGMSMTST